MYLMVHDYSFFGGVIIVIFQQVWVINGGYS